MDFKDDYLVFLLQFLKMQHLYPEISFPFAKVKMRRGNIEALTPLAFFVNFDVSGSYCFNMLYQISDTHKRRRNSLFFWQLDNYTAAEWKGPHFFKSIWKGNAQNIDVKNYMV